MQQVPSKLKYMRFSWQAHRSHGKTEETLHPMPKERVIPDRFYQAL